MAIWKIIYFSDYHFFIILCSILKIIDFFKNYIPYTKFGNILFLHCFFIFFSSTFLFGGVSKTTQSIKMKPFKDDNIASVDVQNMSFCLNIHACTHIGFLVHWLWNPSNIFIFQWNYSKFTNMWCVYIELWLIGMVKITNLHVHVCVLPFDWIILEHI